MEKRTLVAAYKFYCNEELVNAHSAMADTKATYEVLKAQLDRYEETEFEDNKGVKSIPVVNDIEKLSEFSSFNKNVDFVGRIVYDENGVEVFNFGKNKGIPVETVLREQQGYYGWMMNSDFPLYTKKVLTRLRLKLMGK
jgi:DNA polymerase-3 subunit epsilon